MSEIEQLKTAGISRFSAPEFRDFFARTKKSAPAKTPTAIIDLRGVAKEFGDEDAAFLALKNLNLTVKRGEFVAIMGPSGCGKTTLLNIIGLLDRPTIGEYLLENRAVEKFSARKLARLRGQKIGFIFQDFNLISSMNVVENVALPLSYQHKIQYKNEQKASGALARFGLNNREYFMPWQLSGGQRQRVAIARALVSRPDIILADEPTGNLDTENSAKIMDEFAKLHREGNTILMVTHNPDLLKFASRVLYMRDGEIERDQKLTKNAAYGVAESLVMIAKNRPKKEKNAE